MGEDGLPSDHLCALFFLARHIFGPLDHGVLGDAVDSGHLHEAGDEGGDGDGDGDVVDDGHLHEAGDEGGLGHHHSQLPQLVGVQLKASPYQIIIIIIKMQQL